MTDRHLPPTLLKYCPHLITLGRPRRTPKANEHGVIPLEYTKRDFEERNRSVMDFTIAIRTRNRDVAKRELSKEEVSEQYALIIWTLYQHGEPRYDELMGQVRSLVMCTLQRK